MGLNRRTFVAAGGLAALAPAWFAGPAQAGPQQQAKAMVARAIVLYDAKSVGSFKTFDEGKATGYLAGEIYIVVQSRGPGAKVLAHAADPTLVGTRLDKIVDANGKPFAAIMSKDASEQGSWFDYEWPDPTTGKIGRKRSWAVLHKGLVFIAGYYKR